MLKSIHVNQLGYRPGDKKIFIVNGQFDRFQVVEENTNEIIFEGEVNRNVKDKSTDEFAAYGDFTKLQLPGTYYIVINKMTSFSFNISERVFSNVKNGLLKALYFQRCGIKLDKKYADKWHHDICHISKAMLYEEPAIIKDVSGGWHDAGDYGRYVVPACKAVADLLLSYDFFPESFNDQINILESGDGLPDILSEAKYELDWLFKMQDSVTGGVYHKVTTQFFPSMVMPEDDIEPLIIYPMSSQATGDFAAIMSLSSRIYKNLDERFSKMCLQASEKAWGWLVNNPKPLLFINPPNMNSGEYGDRIDLDERLWASAELYRTTGKSLYNKYFESSLENLTDTSSLGWADMGGYGSIAYLFTESSKTNPILYNKLKSKFLNQADSFVNISRNDGYKVTLLPNQYIWGSNMNILNNAMHLIIANMLNPDYSYIDTAIDQWNYLFGLNSLDQSFVTGYGSTSVMNPHHRPSQADGIVAPVPGMISGGPCSGLYEEEAISDCTGLPPAKCFTDKVGSYSTNEITIYWNSPGVFVAGYLCKNY